MTEKRDFRARTPWARRQVRSGTNRGKFAGSRCRSLWFSKWGQCLTA